jgi:phage terminase small subunit
MRKLTDKQVRFIDEYLIDLNATQAYKRAGYSVKSDNAAGVEGLKLLRNPKIQEELKKRQDDLQKRTEITQENVLKELAKIAFSNGTDFAEIVNRTVVDRETHLPIIDEHTGEPRIYKEVVVKATKDIPENKRAAIAAIKENKYGISVESYDKVKALELIGKHIGMFTDKLEVKGNINNPFEGLTTEQLLRLAGEDDDLDE